MDDKTLLYRQVNPKFIKNDLATTQAFRPTKKDEKQLSVYDGSKIEPLEAWEHYTEQLKLISDGVLAISVEESKSLKLDDGKSLKLPVFPKPEENFSEHVIIDFRGLSNNQIKRKAEDLKTKANERGWLYRPNNQDTST